VFEMAAPIQSPAKCEVRSVIRFLNAKGERPAEIHKQIVAVYGDVINRQNVTKWCREFSEGVTDVHDEQRSGRPSLISDDLQKIEREIRANRRHTHSRMKERTWHLAGLWIGAAISNTFHSNKAGSTTAKRARLTDKGSRSTAVLSH
jgi:transposase